ncbi:MAG: hydrolase [Pseudomonadales bacterium]|nr:hydrolase [Pseudomonadales bacterium]
MTGAPAAAFRSPWWLPDAHTQTLWRRFVPCAALPRRRQRLELLDGDFLDLDWVETDTDAHNAPLILLLHGLCGSSDSPYIVALQRQLQAIGLSSVAMNFRGCSGEMNRRARAYHSGCTEDVEAVFQALRAEQNKRPLIGVGYSLGANVLLKWLAEVGDREGVLGAVAVSTPFALAVCSEAMNRGISRLYGHYFRRQLIADVARKREAFRQCADRQEELQRLESLGDLRRLRSLWEFDDQVTAPLHGFSGAPDYYARCSSGSTLAQIRHPVTLIQSANDPIIPRGSLPPADSLPDCVRWHLTDSGGHVGFTSADQPGWLETQILESIRPLLAGAQAARIEVGWRID